MKGLTIDKINVTRFSGVRSTRPKAHTSLKDVLFDIKSEKYKDSITSIHKDENPSKSKIKDKLPVFTPTGTFSYRSIAGLDEYNGLICLDIDNIESPESYKTSLSTIPWITAVFVTPSGKGLKVLVQTNASKETYKDVEIKVAELIESETGLIRDNHCKDIARIQYVSYDPELYVNDSPEMLEF